MRRAGLVAARREGKYVLHRLADDAVLELLASLRRIAERNSAEVERVVRGYFQDRDSLEPVSRPELMERLKAGLVTVLDVRPKDEFALGHLPGAINIPLGELQKKLASLDPEREISRLLPRTLLRAVLRGGRRAKGPRLQGAPPGRRAAGVARDRIAGRARA
jgi:rhodanese-related sulfurtransferase